MADAVIRTLSLVVPFYNEGSGVTYFAQTILPVLESIPDTCWEIVCIDDGSRDDTLTHLIALAELDTRFRVLEFSRNFGKEAAMSAGIDAALGDAVVLLDADLQDPPELIPDMVQVWRGGADVVLGKRMDRSSDSYIKRKTAGWFYRLHNTMTQVRLPENVGDFRLMDRSVVEALKRLPERQRFMKGLFAWVGFRTTTLEYVRPARTVGATKFSVLSLWNLAIEGLTSFSTFPIRLWTYLGTAGAVLALFYGFYIAVRTVIEGNPVPGYASLFVAITFFGSIQIISIGMLGEYIGRIYMETKQRPLYIVRRTYN
ncbi:glycosyltransferase family 2 protein [Acetobacter oeni]|uniref:Glycosyl transferase n=1 Tax=Acetobacter oeni TaxID=304077 RepID=A0A511XKB6_9PROT|nr:glycosyltransferase family 2 protein [Acetobacter oeni]MBB3883849.1 glycosyltransferase involved in cell wall biosynthesis [Acetobacter oeni]NHO19776.1 glycosyltransferase [Acetobacter oeni]GBR03583.1 glycosyltransferase [Acetobacter oeni LMG 21952]GEN63397.1 glycosyl transferase [Acetobacter oeni]